MQIQEGNIRTEQRIAAKAQELEELEKQRVDIEHEKERLLTELDTKQMTLDELLVELEKLEEENARLRAYSEAVRMKKLNFEKQIRHYKEKITDIQGGGQVSSEDKARRIKELKEEIRNYLRLGLDKK
ncbi:MAG: hypothetical protein GY737_26585 [Desulfobacteraceae bacterium]|nr:hypothetical protein [Desulfobacteraceae bacterium]